MLITIGILSPLQVETIGDAYMAVSGLPGRNDKHYIEISKMGLALRNAIDSFKVQHKESYRLKLRIGIHSGKDCCISYSHN